MASLIRIVIRKQQVEELRAIKVKAKVLVAEAARQTLAYKRAEMEIVILRLVDLLAVLYLIKILHGNGCGGIDLFSMVTNGAAMIMKAKQ